MECTSSAEVADIFRFYGHKLTGLTAEEQHIIEQITFCRTAALGGHALKCDVCGYEEISYNSCRNRHCPKCQCLQRAQWVEERKAELLPVPYFHVVFTIPEALNPVALYNKTVVYNLLFQAVSETLKQVAANPKNLGATIGFIALLHTWDQRLNLHPPIYTVLYRAGGSGKEIGAGFAHPKITSSRSPSFLLCSEESSCSFSSMPLIPGSCPFQGLASN